jgi:hypothetical protein
VERTADLRAVLDGLTALPHRGSGTPREADAAAFLRDHLTSRGHRVETQPFRTARTYSWELLGVSLVLALGGLASWAWLAALGLFWFWAYFSGVGTPWDRLFRGHASQNIMARTGDGPHRLMLMAHYDSAKTFFVYHPRRVRGFRANFLLNAALAALLVPAAVWLPLAARAIGVYFLVQGILFVHREATAPYVNGANDNASGVAVAVALFNEMAERPVDGWEIWLLLTGAEEVGAQGARAFLREHALPRDTPVLNIDNVGAGALHYATGEGMLGVRSFHGPLVQAAARLPGATPLVYTLAYFDTLPFARAGHPCLTLIRLDRGLPPHWHWPTDVRAHVDDRAVADTLAYVRALVAAVLRAHLPHGAS